MVCKVSNKIASTGPRGYGACGPSLATPQPATLDSVNRLRQRRTVSSCEPSALTLGSTTGELASTVRRVLHALTLVGHYDVLTGELASMVRRVLRWHG